MPVAKNHSLTTECAAPDISPLHVPVRPTLFLFCLFSCYHSRSLVYFSRPTTTVAIRQSLSLSRSALNSLRRRFVSGLVLVGADGLIGAAGLATAAARNFALRAKQRHPTHDALTCNGNSLNLPAVDETSRADNITLGRRAWLLESRGRSDHRQSVEISPHPSR